MSESVKELLPWITALAGIVAIYFAIKGGRRTDVQDSASDAKMLAKIESGVDSLRNSMEDIRVDMRVDRAKVADHETRLTRVETKVDSLFDRQKGE